MEKYLFESVGHISSELFFLLFFISISDWFFFFQFIFFRTQVVFLQSYYILLLLKNSKVTQFTVILFFNLLPLYYYFYLLDLYVLGRPKLFNFPFAKCQFVLLCSMQFLWPLYLENYSTEFHKKLPWHDLVLIRFQCISPPRGVLLCYIFHNFRDKYILKHATFYTLLYRRENVAFLNPPNVRIN